MDKNQMIDQIDKFFNKVMEKPEKYPVDELVTIIENIIPVHVSLEITSYDDVDVLLSVYPYFYQKIIRLYAYFIHKVRIGVQNKDKAYADIMRTYRDPIEELISAVKLQYDSLSRRITNNIERGR
jgi:hypothetical protein